MYLVDTVAFEDVTPLGELLENRRIEKVFHSADNDIRVVDRQWGYRVLNLFDTGIGAQFLGSERLGLGVLTEEYLDVTLDKSKKLQRADWSLRPLSDASIQYAANDVYHLVNLRDVLTQRLRTLGRSEWVAEECRRLEELRYIPPGPVEDSFASIKGSSALDGSGLAVLRELVLFREKVALRRGRPPFRVLSNGALLAIAADPSVELSKVPGITDNILQRLGRELRPAIRRGVKAPPIVHKSRRGPFQPRPTPAQVRLAGGLRSWRTEQGKGISLDPALVWPAASLDRLSRAPDTLSQELESHDVRRWQAREFGQSLQTYLSTV